jgi:hypothetical protein
MRVLIEILAGLAILANAVIYGTDVFGAIVLRPAIAAVDDRTLTQLLGHVHRIADRRFAAIGIVGLTAAMATAALAAATGHSPAGCRATLASSRPAGTRSSTHASRCRPSHSPHCASRSPRPDPGQGSCRMPASSSTSPLGDRLAALLMSAL